MRATILLIIISAFSFVGATDVERLGTSVGNFDHQFEMAFDFHIAYPKDWNFSEKNRGAGDPILKTWVLSNLPVVKTKSDESSLRVDFIIESEINGIDDLLDFAKSKHPEVKKWTVDEANEIAAVQSPDIAIDEHSSQSYEYFLTRKNQIIAIETRKSEASSGASTVDLILSSISRSSRPPEVRSIIHKNSDLSVSEGQQLCYLIQVDDLKNRITENSLTQLNFREEDPLFLEKSVNWDVDESRFEACVKIQANSTIEGSLIKRIVLSNDSGQTTTCESEEATPLALECDHGPKGLALSLPNVKIQNPDREGPNITSIQWNKSSELIEIHLNDAHELGGGVIHLDNGKTRLIYPSDFGAGSVKISLASVSDEGWNRIEGLAFFDSNGERTVLERPDKVSDHDNEFYILNKRGQREKSPFAIINYLVIRKGE